MKLSDFDYILPRDLIATTPKPERSDSRLLIGDINIIDCNFNNIVDYINPGDLLVTNNTRVIKARLFGTKLSGGKVEIMLERVINASQFIAHVRTSKTIQIGMHVNLPGGLVVKISERLSGGLFKIDSTDELDLYTYLEQHGNLPLPPYMQRQAEASDENRYQTVYACYDGSVAAPTAGLHFTPQLLEKISQKGAKICSITLHVGSGTFKPVSVENIYEHKMHSEIFEINQETIDLIQQTKNIGGKIICVGTTSLRTLETVALRGLHAQRGETDIFISPGFQFKLVDKLITNFHLPRSTLLMLVSAFAGKDLIDKIYQHAINRQYRFFSYGDAMLLARKDS